MSLTSKKVSQSPHKTPINAKNELRSINDVLKYDKRASPIRKKSSNRVRNVVKNLEKPQNKKSKKSLGIDKDDKKTGVDEYDVGSLHNQLKIKHFFG